MFAIDYYSGSLIAGAGVAVISLILIIMNSSKEEFRNSWILLNITTVMWSASYFAMITADTFTFAIVANLLLHAGAIIIPYTFLLVVSRITQTESYYVWHLRCIAVVALFFELINPFPQFVVTVAPNFGFNYLPVAGPLYIYFTLYFFSVIGFSLIVLWRAHQRATERITKLRLRYFLIASILGFSGGAGVFFMTFGIPIKPYLLALFPAYPLIITVAATRVSIFETRVLTAELFTFFLVIFALIRGLLAVSLSDQLISSIVLVLSLGVGFYLVKSVRKEVTTRELAEKLAQELESANTQLAALNAQKSEFLSIATHQLRTPLGAMNGYTSLILGGSFGEINDKIREVLSKVLQSGMLMNGTIEDFLSVSRIDQGRMVYDMTDFPIQKLTQEVYDELKAGAERKNLHLIHSVPEGQFVVHADYGKLKHVISNLVDNSIKYTREGSVTISAERKDAVVRVCISDTGVGIPQDEIGKLFDKFVRARGAAGVNVSGTGLGLYVAKQMIEAHKGRVWAESDGEGKGSRFIAEIPLVTPQ